MVGIATVTSNVRNRASRSQEVAFPGGVVVAVRASETDASLSSKENGEHWGTSQARLAHVTYVYNQT